MKIWSTPPQRHRPRNDYEGSMVASIGSVGGAAPTVTLLASYPDDDGGRLFRVHLTADECRAIGEILARYERKWG